MGIFNFFKKTEKYSTSGDIRMPDIEDRPDWANWLAIDKDGQWHWFEKKTSAYFDLGLWSSSGARERVVFRDWDYSLKKVG